MSNDNGCVFCGCKEFCLERRFAFWKKSSVCYLCEATYFGVLPFAAPRFDPKTESQVKQSSTAEAWRSRIDAWV